MTIPWDGRERLGDWDRTSDLLFPKQFMPYLPPINIVSN